MKVETFEAISLDVARDGSVVNEQVSEEALALIETLDLGGQRSMLQKKNVGGEEVVVRNPYRRMSAEELAIYSVLMPNRVELAKYSDGPIPLRALQVAAHAQSLDCFDKGLEVWCPQPGRDDPLLVGVRKGQYDSRELYMLARWGDELLELVELRAKALPIVLAKVRGDIAKAKGELASFEAGLEDKVTAYLCGAPNDHMFVSVGFAR